MDKNLQSLFEHLGLTEEEAKVYLAALELGEASMQELATKSGIPRTSIYNFMRSMIKRRLIATGVRKKRTVYSAIHPNQLVEIEHGRMRELQTILPELLAIHNKSQTKPRVTFHEGVEGIKEVLYDMLKEKQDVAAWSDFKAMAENLGEYYFDVFPAERAKKKIVSRNIVLDTPKARQLAKSDAKYFRETKFWNAGEVKIEINIYGNKVALNSYRGNPFAVLIEDTAIADTLRLIWQEQWDKLG